MVGVMVDVFEHYETVKSQAGARDDRHRDVIAARRGDMEALAPGMFPKNFPRQVTANIVGIASRDVGEMLGSLPSVGCSPATSTHKEMKRASKKTKIAAYYLEKSALQRQMYSGGDRYSSFGFLPFVSDPDFDIGCPVIRVDNPVGAYYELDLQGRCKVYYKRWYEYASQLAAKFPELADKIKRPDHGSMSARAADMEQIEIVKCYYKTALGQVKCSLFLPYRDNLVLKDVTYEGLTRMPVAIAERPKWDEEIRGQFDEALWVQVARARMELYTLQAADQAVNAPMKVPPDVTKIPTGPQAMIRSSSQQPIERVRMDIPQGVFGENARLQSEERLAARYPEGRSGNIDASVITGQGVQALLGTMDTQLKAYQDNIRWALQETISVMFELDQLYWGDTEKAIEGEVDGKSFREKYTPDTDIDGDYRVDVSYGFAAGLDPNRALVFLLQLRGDRLVDRDTVMRQLPFEVDVMSMKERIDNEEIDDALKQGLFGLAAAIGSPDLAQMGIDPRKIVQQMATIKVERSRGKALHEAVLKAFEPTEEELAAQEQEQMNPLEQMIAAEGEMGGGEVPARGMGSPAGGGGGDLQMLLAGLTPAGNPNLSASVSRMRSA